MEKKYTMMLLSTSTALLTAIFIEQKNAISWENSDSDTMSEKEHS